MEKKMNTKLTLNIEQELIETAKKYAKDRRQSLSSLVQNFFKILDIENSEQDEIKISPELKELSGIIKLDNDYDYKEDYKNHIIEKYS
jgi:hypothetical protein